MGGLIGFLLGYYAGAKDGPERLEELRQAVEDIAESSEFQALRSSLGVMLQQSLAQMQAHLGGENRSDGTSPSDAWKTITESEEFKGLMATGAMVLQGMLANVMPRERPNGQTSSGPAS